jgi:hypothetical protein
MSFKPEIEVTGEAGQWYQNGQTFATMEEAEKSASNRFYNWTSATGHRAVEVSSEEFPVNYKWVDGVGDVRIEDEPKPVYEIPLMECINPKVDKQGRIVYLTPPEGLTKED